MAADKVHVLSFDDTPQEDLEGGGWVRRIVTKEKTGIDLTFSRGFATPNCGHAMHSHDKDEVMYCLKGGGTMSFEDQEDIEYTEGMCFVIPRNVRHCNTNTTDGELHVVSIFNPALR